VAEGLAAIVVGDGGAQKKIGWERANADRAESVVTKTRGFINRSYVNRSRLRSTPVALTSGPRSSPPGCSASRAHRASPCARTRA
jgi:hypothetical protein